MFGVEKKTGAFTIRVDRIGALGTDIPFQLFGAIGGVHEVAQQSGDVSDYAPVLNLNGNTQDQVSRFDTNGNLELIDTATGNGVRISTNRNNYKFFLQLIADNKNPLSTSVLSTNVKIEFNSQNTRRTSITERMAGFYNESEGRTYELAEYFIKSQEQNDIIDINEVFDITPTYKLDSVMDAQEDSIIYTFTMTVID